MNDRGPMLLYSLLILASHQIGLGLLAYDLYEIAHRQVNVDQMQPSISLNLSAHH